jgi:hypothetical protein
MAPLSDTTANGTQTSMRCVTRLAICSLAYRMMTTACAVDDAGGGPDAWKNPCKSLDCSVLALNQDRGIRTGAVTPRPFRLAETARLSRGLLEGSGGESR